jgi:hypothetical protein
VKDLYPEYYILCVEDFDNAAKDGLDEWIYYLKNNAIPDGFTAPGLSEARKRLQYDKLTEQEKRDYSHHLKQRLYEQGSINTAARKGRAKGEAIGLKKGEAIGLKKGKAEGEAIGLKKGKAEGEAIGLKKGKAEGEAIGLKKGKAEVVLNSFRAGLPAETISTITGLSPGQILEMLKRHGFM